MTGDDRRGWRSALALALLWGVGLALPTLLRGELLGHPHTDLYPSVWGLWASGADPLSLLSAHTLLLGHPEGMGYAYASPLKGLLAVPLLPLLGVTWTWNGLVLLARVATPLCAYGAGRAWGLSPGGALVAAGAWGCAPFFQGYAVEGIVEGTDGWTLALWAWAAGARRPVLAGLALGLSLISSWYLGAAGCLLALLSGLRLPRLAWVALPLGVLVALPLLLRFLGAFPEAAPLPDAVRAAMGAPLQIPSPGLQRGLSPFALNAYVGVLLGGAALASRSWGLLALALLPAILSLGMGPWYDLPVLAMIRFPYRWHAATLALLALAAGRAADRYAPRWGGWLGPLLVAEGLLLSPVEPLLPGAPAQIPAIYAQVDAPLLEVPGPVALPPGEINPSRGRARYLLYAQTAHHQPSPWRPDFNGLLPSQGEADALDPLRRFDRLASPDLPPEAWRLSAEEVDRLRTEKAIALILIQRRELDSRRARALLDALEAHGAQRIAEDRDHWLLRLPSPSSSTP